LGRRIRLIGESPDLRVPSPAFPFLVLPFISV
jgi:hypothetical protein